jgi:hypothetical protein
MRMKKHQKAEVVKILEEYYPSKPKDLILKTLHDAGLPATWQYCSKTAHQYGIRRLTRVEIVQRKDVINIETPWDTREIYPQFLDPERKDTVWCSVITKGGREIFISLRFRHRSTNLKKNENFKVYLSHIKSEKTSGVSDDEFYCLRCNTVHPRSFARQKGKHGANKCKKCYNIGRVEERAANPQAKIKNKLHCYTHHAYSGEKMHSHPGSILHDLVGCTSQEFRNHIEKQFEPGWTHEDRGKIWELDHIIPYANYDLTDPQQVKQVMHYTNVRPISIFENRSKGSNVED